MIEIKFTLSTVEEGKFMFDALMRAIEELRASAGQNDSPDASETVVPAGEQNKGDSPASTPATAAPAKRGRSRKATEEAPAEAEQEQAAPAADPLFSVVPAAIAATQPFAGPLAAPSLKDVQNTVEELFKAKQTSVTMAVMQRWGVTSGRKVPEENRAQFIAYCQRVITGKADPIAGTDVEV